ncbi:urease subunit beta [Massilia sp. B-10]|nr:urease subunit beta [Massilia sp. B-10]
MIPGQYLLGEGDIAINEGRATVTLVVANSGDRPIQVGSHFHFFEVNTALVFGRSAAIGMRLNIAAKHGGALEPGQQRTVELVALDSARRVFGFNGLVMGDLPPQGGN